MLFTWACFSLPSSCLSFYPACACVWALLCAVGRPLVLVAFHVCMLRLFLLIFSLRLDDRDLWVFQRRRRSSSRTTIGSTLMRQPWLNCMTGLTSIQQRFRNDSTTTRLATDSDTVPPTSLHQRWVDSTTALFLTHLILPLWCLPVCLCMSMVKWVSILHWADDSELLQIVIKVYSFYADFLQFFPCLPLPT